MKNSSFRFKQFSVSQDKCAMKVNTDGVLLGARAEVSSAKNILDIGTGTGVIALMLAQKNNEAIIDAIDIDEHAFAQARENFKQSKWSERLNAIHTSLQKFVTQKKYDVVISNPPYFVNDLKTNNPQKNIAKHSVALTFEELFSGINNLLAESGKVFLCIPAFHFATVEMMARKENLFITQTVNVSAVGGKPSYLTLLRLEREEKEISKTQLNIQQANGEFTREYISLAKDFYLKF